MSHVNPTRENYSKSIPLYPVGSKSISFLSLKVFSEIVYLQSFYRSDQFSAHLNGNHYLQIRTIASGLTYMSGESRRIKYRFPQCIQHPARCGQCQEKQLQTGIHKYSYNRFSRMKGSPSCSMLILYGIWQENIDHGVELLWEQNDRSQYSL